MTLQTELQDRLTEIRASDEELITQQLQSIEEHLSESSEFTIANIWITTPVELQQTIQFDTIVLLHSNHSAQEMKEEFYLELREMAVSDLITRGIRVQGDGIITDVIPTKYARQGTITQQDRNTPHLADILGGGELLQQASALLQSWQVTNKLDIETQALLPFEIEITLNHLIDTYQPQDLTELLEFFFDFVRQDKFSGQMSVHDRDGNIILYHDFLIPDKQIFLKEVFETQQAIKINQSLSAILDR